MPSRLVGRRRTMSPSAPQRRGVLQWQKPNPAARSVRRSGAVRGGVARAVPVRVNRSGARAAGAGRRPAQAAERGLCGGTAAAAAVKAAAPKAA